MVTLRDLGKWFVDRAPSLTPFAKRIYRRFPESWHDTPTSRLRVFYGKRETVTFLQIGAYDGLAGDPLRQIVANDERWRGILVEPQPHAFERLKRNYRDAEDRLIFINGAISSARGEKEFYSISPETIERMALPRYFEELASFVRSNLVKNAPGVPIETTYVATLTVTDVLAIARYSKVDCLVLDVEGFEAILLDSIDFDRLDVSFVIFEHKHLCESDIDAVTGRLTALGFTIKVFGRDTIAWRAIRD